MTVSQRNHFLVEPRIVEGKGHIHSCGNIGHLVDDILALPSLRSLDMGQSELNDMDAIYTKAATARVPLIRVAVSADEIASGRAETRFPTGASLIFREGSLAEAQTLVNVSWTEGRGTNLTIKKVRIEMNIIGKTKNKNGKL